MAASPVIRRRIATVLAFVLAAESVSAVSVAAVTLPTAPEGPGAAAVAPARTLFAQAVPADAAEPVDVSPSTAPRFAPRIVELPEPAVAVVAPEPEPEPVAAAPRPNPENRPKKSEAPRRAAQEPGRKAERKPANRTGGAPRVAQPREFRGTNHVWIPFLGISKSIRWFPCDRQRPPDNYMYRWGCAGNNNVYLMGHAYSVMEPLHDAYVSGRLKVGMKAYWADGDGNVHKYSVKWWKVTRPTPDASWAWAAQDSPSMTLQTCVGRNSEFRLMVRLDRVD